MRLAIVKQVTMSAIEPQQYRSVKFQDLVLGSQGIVFDGVETMTYGTGDGPRCHAYEFKLVDGTRRHIGIHEEINPMGPHGMGTVTSSWDGKTYALAVMVGGLVVLHINEVKSHG